LSEDHAVVTSMLALAGLTASADELDDLVVAHAAVRTGLDLLYGPDFRDADPLLTPTAAMEALRS
jgi:hypothetical protein